MTATIRFYCVSLLLFFSVSGEETFLFDSISRVHSTWDVVGKPTVVDVKESQSSELDFTSPDTFTFTLKKVTLDVDAGKTKLSNDTEHPGSVLSLAELSHFVDRPMKITLVDHPPYFQFEETFAKQFFDLQTFDKPVFEGLLIDALRQWREILKHPLKQGESYTISFPKTDQQAYESQTVYTVQESSEEQVVVESVFTIGRQKSTLPGEKENEIPVVVLGELKGRFVIQKRNLKLFRFEEKGFISYSIGYEEQPASIRHELERSAETKRKDGL